MVQQLPDRPFLPKGSGLDPAFDVLVKALTDFLGKVITRSNGLLPKDGTEAMTQPLILEQATVAQLEGGSPTYVASVYTGALVYCTDDTGGAVPAFSDGTNWRRMTDRNVVST